MANKELNIKDKINLFISHNPGVYVHKVIQGQTVIFQKFYNNRNDKDEVVNDLYFAYFDVLSDDPTYTIYEGTDDAIRKEKDKILFNALYKLREIERQPIRNNQNTPVDLNKEGSVIERYSGSIEMDTIDDMELEFLKLFEPDKLEQEEDNIFFPDKNLFNEIIESCFDLPYFEQEAYKLRFEKPALIKHLVELKERLKLYKNNKTSSKSAKSSGLNLSENEIKIIRRQISNITDQLINFEESELAKSFNPDGILQLQKRAYIRIYAGWEVMIKPKVIKYLLENRSIWSAN